jgi:hypothetical protein
MAVVVASSLWRGLESVAAAASHDDGDDEARIEEATRLFLGGQYAEAEKRLVELVAGHPEVPNLQRKLGLCYYYLRRPGPALTNLRGYLARERGISAQDREDVERWIREMEGLRDPTAYRAATVPSFERGFLLVPYAGWQFPVNGPGWFASAFRFGTLIGGHLSRNIFLGGEPAFATWSFAGCGSCGEPHHAAQLDASATLLGHVSWSRTELVFGPKLGWSIVLRNNFDEHTFMFVNGPQIGTKMGVFVALSRWVALGVAIDLAYTRSRESDSRCFETNGVGELDCNNTKNTAFGALSAALLL